MKSKNTPKPQSSRFNLLEVAFLALPFLALVPNFFIIPDLTFPGLATQEFVFSLMSSIFALIGLIELVRMPGGLLKLSRRRTILFALLVAFIIWQAISLTWAPSFADGIRVVGIWFGFAVFLFAGMTCLSQQGAVRLHYVMTVICAILAVSLLYERAKFGEVMLGIFFNHGITSELMATLLPLQLVNYLCSRKQSLMVASLLVSGLSVLALLAGLRRGAILGTVFVLIVLGVLLALKQIKLASKQRLITVAAVLIVAATFVGVRYREAIAFRIQGATQLNSAEGGLTSRLRGWITAWEMGKRNVLIGVGNGGYPSLYGEYRRYFTANPAYSDVVKASTTEESDEIRSPLVHNEYLQIFVELGIVGLALFAAFWFLLVGWLWKGRNASEGNSYWVVGALLGLTAFAVSSIFSSFSLRFTPGAFMVACLLSIGIAFTRSSGKAAEKENHVESEDPTITLPKIAGIAALGISLIVCLGFTARNYNVYASQRLQGRQTLRTEALDFNYYPDRPADSERLERRYKQVLDMDSDNTGAHLGYGLLLFQMKRPAEAIPHLTFGLKHGYNRPYGYVALAFAHEWAGDLFQASQVMHDCLESYPQSVFARTVYAEMLRKEGKTSEAQSQLDIARKQDALVSLSWENALRLKPEDALAEAERRKLIAPNKLFPSLAMRLVFWRAFHYLR